MEGYAQGQTGEAGDYPEWLRQLADPNDELNRPGVAERLADWQNQQDRQAFEAWLAENGEPLGRDGFRVYYGLQFEQEQQAPDTNTEQRQPTDLTDGGSF
jgi:hypothetical protein